MSGRHLTRRSTNVRGVRAPRAPVQVLERAAGGSPVDAGDVVDVVRAWLDGGADDAQMAALSVTGWAPATTPALVDVLLAAGDRLELARLEATGGFVSTGAVGDPTELAVAPVAAALGVRVAVLASAAAGAVIGGQDKLGCIPGMRVGRSAEELARGARDAGIVVGAPVGRLASGVRRMARLAEGVGVSRLPRILAPLTAARALAPGTAAVLVDVPTGSAGALCGDAAQVADAVGDALVAAGRGARVTTSVADSAIGPAIGTALEVAAVGALLLGEGDTSLRDRVADLAGRLAEAAGVRAQGTGRAAALEALAHGAALAAAERWVESQGGHPEVWTDDALLARAPTQRAHTASRDGIVGPLDIVALAELARWLGAGRMHPAQAIDFAAGVEVLVRAGESVSRDQPLIVLHGRDPAMVDAALAGVGAAVPITEDA